MKNVLLTLALTVGAVPGLVHAACTSPMSVAATNYASSSEADEIWANWAFYEWNEATQGWVLAE